MINSTLKSGKLSEFLELSCVEELDDAACIAVSGGYALFVPVYTNPSGNGTPYFFGLDTNNNLVENVERPIDNIRNFLG